MNDATTPVIQESYGKSICLHREAEHHLPGGVSSNFRLNEKPVPIFFERAEGPRLLSVDGVSYLDYALGMGPVILGHAHPAVNRAVSDSLANGQLYAGQHAAEIHLAKLICEVVPCAEQVRFNLSGSEAIQGALRLARAYTGRRKVIKFEGHYHGWFDNIYASVRPDPRSSGDSLPQAESEGQSPSALSDLVVLPWNDLGALDAAMRQHAADLAAVIMEPVMCNTGMIFPRPGYLQGVRDLCTRHGVTLIFDEVITGFRLSLGGAQSLLGVTPDLAIFAKAFANGFPGSCLAGKAAWMELIASGRVMHGGTYNANVVSTAAAIATIEELRRDGGPYSQIDEHGRALQEGLRAEARAAGVPMVVQGTGSVFHAAFTDAPAVHDYREFRAADAARLAHFVEALLDSRVRITRRGTWFLSAAHTRQDIEQTIAASRHAFRALR